MLKSAFETKAKRQSHLLFHRTAQTTKGGSTLEGGFALTLWKLILSVLSNDLPAAMMQIHSQLSVDLPPRLICCAGVPTPQLTSLRCFCQGQNYTELQ